MSSIFGPQFSALSISWLRAYDFGLEEELLIHAVKALKHFPLVQTLCYLAEPDEIDEVDARMFDVRYQLRSQLSRIRLEPAYIVDQDLGIGRKWTGSITVNLCLDLASGFGIFNLSMPLIKAQDDRPFTVEEIGFLMRQWLLCQDDLGQPQHLMTRLPQSDQLENLYIREIMNFYFLQLHNVLWKECKPDIHSPTQQFTDYQHWVSAAREVDPIGCLALRELYQLDFLRSLYPTSFGPIVDIWGIEGSDPADFDADTFSNHYASEIAWLFTDGQRTTLGEYLLNQRKTKSLAFYIWPNHALYINQNQKAIEPRRVEHRVQRYSCLDLEIIRILEILNLQSALLHAFDSFLDQQLEKVTTLEEYDQKEVIRLIEQRKKMARSTQSFDFYNLFHTAYWEPLYARLLEHPHLRLKEAANLVDLKLARLDEEIQQTVIIQDRGRQRQQQEQELEVLRGLHSLGLANDVQSNALLKINFLVSATASFGFTEVLQPWLTAIFKTPSPFSDVYPFVWIVGNVAIFLFFYFILTGVSSSIIRRKNQIIELVGTLDLPLNASLLQSYCMKHKGLTYLHINTDDRSGYLRIQKLSGVLVFEFDSERIYRYSLLLHGRQPVDHEQIRKAYVDDEIQKLFKKQGITA